MIRDKVIGASILAIGFGGGYIVGAIQGISAKIMVEQIKESPSKVVSAKKAVPAKKATAVKKAPSK